MTDRPPHGQHLAPGAQLPPKPASVPATPKPAEPRDLAWARRCATDYQTNPTDARARNAAQCLPGILAAYDNLMKEAAIARAVAHIANLPSELCHAPHPAQARPDLKCYLAAGHTGDHSTNQWPGNRTWGRSAGELARERAAALAHLADGLDVPPEIRDLETHGLSAAHAWRRVGIDPCPARSNQRESCTKGYLHAGAHQWGPTRPIEAGPELPEQERAVNCRSEVAWDTASAQPPGTPAAATPTTEPPERAVSAWEPLPEW